MQYLRKHFKRYMVRPMLYRAFTRLILGLTAALLWDHFVNVSALLPMRTFAFLFLGVLLLVAAWMSYLRLDGIKAPQFDRKIFDWHHKPVRTYGDMIDYVNEDVVDFEDLEEDEQSLCLLLADVLCGVIFLVASFI